MVKAALIDKDKVAGVCCRECATVVITLLQFQIISCYLVNAKSVTLSCHDRVSVLLGAATRGRNKILKLNYATRLTNSVNPIFISVFCFF